MSAIPLSLGAYKRSLFPEAILLNAVAEQAPTQQQKAVAIRARPGHSAFQTIGSAPLRALFSRRGLFDDAAIVVMANGIYTLSGSGSVTQIAGSIPGYAPVEIDAGQDADLNSVAMIATGNALYKVTADGAVVDNLPGETGASSICYHRGFWFGSQTGTDQVYYRVPGDTSWLVLSFASAEYAPDPIVAIRKLGEQIWFLGSASTEPWALTGQASPAVQPYGGLNYDFGCRSRSAAVSLPNALIWVDSACQVRMTQGGSPNVISDNGLSEQIRKVGASDLRGSWYERDGHIYYHLTLGAAATWVFDVTTQQWSRQSTSGSDYSKIGPFATMGEQVLAGSFVSNQIYRVEADALSDAGTPYPVEFTAFAEVLERSIPCVNVELVCDVGDAPWVGAGSDPIIKMRFSDDAGKSWTRWYERPLGKAGQTDVRVRWTGLGTIQGPRGRIFHFAVSDPVGRRFSDLRMNVT